MMKLSNRVYDILKWLAAPCLPAIATLLVGASQIWNIPELALIGATVTLIATCFGELTGQSSKKYFADKEIVFKENADGEV